MSIVMSILLDGVVAALVTLGFGIIFNVPKKYLWAACLVGAIAHATKFTLELYGVDLVIAVLIASFIVGITGAFLAGPLRVPPVILTYPSVISMIPGSLLSKALVAFIRLMFENQPNPDLFYQAMNYGMRSGFIVLSLGMGVSIPNVVYNKWKKVNKIA